MKHNRILSLMALIVPAALAAQQPPAQQKPANPTMFGFKTIGNRYGGWLAQAFDSIPASKYGYKPTPVQQTFGYIAQHLEDANYQLCTRASGMTHPMTARDSLADTVKAMWPKDTLVARLKASLTFCENAIASLDDTKLNDDMPAGPPGSGRTIARSRYLMGYITDLAEHYAQVASYMRLNGMIPPSALPRPSR